MLSLDSSKDSGKSARRGDALNQKGDNPMQFSAHMADYMELSGAIIRQESFDDLLALICHLSVKIADALVAIVLLVEDDKSIKIASGAMAFTNRDSAGGNDHVFDRPEDQWSEKDFSTNNNLLTIMKSLKPVIIYEPGDFITSFLPEKIASMVAQKCRLKQAACFQLNVADESVGTLLVASVYEIDAPALQPIAHMAEQVVWNNRRLNEIRYRRDQLEKLIWERTSELEKKNKELEARQAILVHQEKMASIGQLAAGVAHEINNPVAYLLSNLNILHEYIREISEYECMVRRLTGSLEKISDKSRPSISTRLKKLKKINIQAILSDVRDLVNESLEGANRVKEIVENLRYFSRPGEKKVIEADINEGIEKTLNVIWNEIKYKARIHKELKPLPSLRCHPQELNQVFLNIIMNALQALPKRGDIWLRTECDDGTIRIEIEDNGSGIEEDVQQRIFDPFFTTKEVGQGTGLGLSISYNIIKRHGGLIEMASEPGKGTRITVVLPQEGLPAEERKKETHETAKTKPKAMTSFSTRTRRPPK